MGGQPTAPDPATGIQLGQQVAGQQQTLNTQAGTESQRGSMVDQSNPYGSLSYTQTGTSPDGTPIYSSSLQFSPEQQNLYSLLTGSKATAGSEAGALLSGAAYGSQNPSDVIGDMTKGTTQQILGHETDYLNPFFTTQKSQLDNQLRNQGLVPGEPGYDNAIRSLDTNQGLTVSDFLAKAEPQAFSQAVTGYELPAQLASTLGAFGAPTSPGGSLVNAPQLSIQPANLTGAVNTEQTALDEQYKAQLAQHNNTMSGLFGIPTAILGGWSKAGFPGLGTAAAAV